MKPVCAIEKQSQGCGSRIQNMLYLETLTNIEVCRAVGCM